MKKEKLKEYLKNNLEKYVVKNNKEPKIKSIIFDSEDWAFYKEEPVCFVFPDKETEERLLGGLFRILVLHSFHPDDLEDVYKELGWL